MRDWSSESMSSAIAAVRGGASIRKASQMYSVPRSTLYDRVNGSVEEGSKWGTDSHFSIEEENEMISAAVTRAEKGIGFSKSSFLRFVGVFAEEKGKPFKKSKPSDMWWRGLKSRHPTFSLRSPEATATSRHNAMTRERISGYFKDWKQVFDQTDLLYFPNRIWNMDETGIHL